MPRFIIFFLIQPLLAYYQYTEYREACTDSDCARFCTGWDLVGTSEYCEEACVKHPIWSVYINTGCEEIAYSTACCYSNFTMWNDKHFSLQGECDIVLYSNPNFASGAGLVIQIRTEIKKYYTFIRNLAIKFGDQYFEVEKRKGPGVNFYYNGRYWKQPPRNFGGYLVRKVENATWCENQCSGAQILNFEFEELGSVEVGNWAGFLHATISLRPPSYDGSVGLLGKPGEIGFYARNGSILQNADQYGKEWQVLDTEPILFHKSRSPRYPEQCIMSKSTPSQIKQP